MKAIVITFALFLSALSVCAQYFSTKEHQQFHYYFPQKGGNETKTVVEVDRAENGDVKVILENITETDGLDKAFDGKLLTKLSAEYNAQTDISTLTLFTGEAMKNIVLQGIELGFKQNGKELSAEDLAKLESIIVMDGKIDLVIDPKAAPGDKLPDSFLSVSAGPLTMAMNLWDGKYLGRETITVKAGTFDCIKISYVLRTKLPNGIKKQNVTMWLAEGIGEVRSESKSSEPNDDVDQELISID